MAPIHELRCLPAIILKQGAADWLCGLRTCRGERVPIHGLEALPGQQDTCDPPGWLGE